MGHEYPVSFGKYILLRPLAHGGMGELFLALSGEIGGFEKLCVIKRVRSTAQNEALVRRFMDEAKVVIQLSHGNLVQVFDVGIAEEEIFLAMEFVDGHDLREVLELGAAQHIPLPLDVALYVATQICRGLHYAHEYSGIKLVHRDICPSNILVSFFGEIKITDFGLAQSVFKQENTAPNKLLGRISYLAPEQARREEADHRTDIYAAGVVLWEMLVGRQMRPGPHTDVSLALRQIRQGKVTPPSELSPRVTLEMDRIVLKALNVDRHKRFSSAEEMRQEVARILSRMNPTFDSGGVAKFMHRLYGAEIFSVRQERDQLLARAKELIPQQTIPEAMAASAAVRQTKPDGVQPEQIINGRYQVVRLLGEGGMGAVYEVRHLGLDRRLAMKILHSVFSGHSEPMARFKQEARAATKIGHPNIVEVLDSGTTEDGRLFFVMELLEGTDLADVMAQNRIVPLERSLRIALQVCRGLQAAHDAGIVHRDLKPENIYLTRRDGHTDFVKLLDFGIAKNLELAATQEMRLTSPGIALGTPEYMAPEQAAGEDVDRRIDIYALGAMLYEMLTGRLPYEGENLIQVLNRMAEGPPKPPSAFWPAIPPELERIILKALAPKKEDRYNSMEEMAEDLLPLVKPDQTVIEASSPGRRASHEHNVPAASDVGGKNIAYDPTVSAAQLAERMAREDSIVQIHGAIVRTLLVVFKTKAAINRAAQITASKLNPLTKKWLRRDLKPSWIVIVWTVLLALLIFWPMSHFCGSSGDSTSTAVTPAIVADVKPTVTLSKETPRVAVPPSAKAKAMPPMPEESPKLTLQEVQRLIEWAKRAADGQRYIKPKGDNVRELLQRIEDVYPDHPEVIKLRQSLYAKFEKEGLKALKAKQLTNAEKIYRAWLAFDVTAAEPRRVMAIIEISAARKSLSRNQVQEALQHARMAQKFDSTPVEIPEILGDIALKRKQYEQALYHYEGALATPQLDVALRNKLMKKVKIVQKKISN